MPRSTTKRSTSARIVVCTHCGETTEVGRRAMSVACPHCHKRLILEDFKIAGYYGVRQFSTCGDIVVEKTGNVAASIQVDNLTVIGTVRGNVVARGRVILQKTASYTGDIDASVLRIDSGAEFSGFVRIGEAINPESNAK